MDETITWIPECNEKPVDGEPVLIFGAMQYGDKTMCVWFGWYDEAIGIWQTSATELDNVTHWAAVPKGPH